MTRRELTQLLDYLFDGIDTIIRDSGDYYDANNELNIARRCVAIYNTTHKRKLDLHNLLDNGQLRLKYEVERHVN